MTVSNRQKRANCIDVDVGSKISASLAGLYRFSGIIGILGAKIRGVNSELLELIIWKHSFILLILQSGYTSEYQGILRGGKYERAKRPD